MALPFPLAHHIPTLVFILITVLVRQLINRTQPTPYIDEIFHIPQAQRYCVALDSNRLGVAQRLRHVEYDAKLTTPPGLYLISLALAKTLPGWQCNDVVWLRSTNLVLLLTLPVLVARILRQTAQLRCSNLEAIQPPSHREAVTLATASKPARYPKNAISRREIEMLQQKARAEQPPTPGTSHDDLAIPAPQAAAIVSEPPPPSRTGASTLALRAKPNHLAPSPYHMAVACTISLLPPLWFFGFLYYTDLASVWLILACITVYNDLTSSAKKSDTRVIWINAASITAVLVRQTNVVWILFAAAQATLAQLANAHHLKPGLVDGLSDLLSSALGVGEQGKQRRDAFWSTVRRNVAPLTPMLLACAWFVKWNGSIVLGDQANHQAGLHLPQLGYFVAFSSVFGVFSLIYSLSASSDMEQRSSAPAPARRSARGELVHGMKSALAAVTKACFGSASRLASFALVLSFLYAAVHKFTLDHPFLVADNRHYTFYMWRYFRRTYPLAGTRLRLEPRFAMVPLYAVALFGWGCALVRRHGSLLALLLGGATAATLIPTPLLEVRYFLIPYVLLRLYTQPQERAGRAKWMWLSLELALYALVNALSVGLFVYRPFQWAPDAVDTTRHEQTLMRFIW